MKALLASLLLGSMLLVCAACGGAPVPSQDGACKTTVDCQLGYGLTCVPLAGGPERSCEIVCATDADCPNQQTCDFENGHDGLRYCMTNPG